ncbi:hypothetical protein JCM17844_19440 [Iodidimonas gelatinilytica]|uniref:NADH:flavin oxidoreductase/NADH oxidase N-terminal domain-containing protein n=1 Tax=Iodidimonas gelatinilytica TaxID=1236966 RepID=A0A5A7MQW3_9PROT|nr:NADH:flavin oxidoreductase [Iodidimonas gelatinilytica]GEQ98307.1 hypothetical protein JCM17844_19440 [Iodidimonas gelatinilytica]
MYKPRQRIAYPSSAGFWPDEAQAKAARLFSPLEAGPLFLKERSWVPAMVPWRASADGFVTDEVLDWYGRFAQSRPGAIVVEATGIRDIPSGPLLRIGDDRFLLGLQKLVKRVHEESGGQTRLLIQLIDFLAIRRRPKPETYFDRYLELTDRHRDVLNMADASDADIRAYLKTLDDEALKKVLSPREWETLEMGYRERVTDTHLPHIRDLPQTLPGLFADAARRAKEAGFDGVELHYAHAYTMASFLSALNTRTDGYGGVPEHRLRLPLDVYFAVRDAVGKGYAVGCRFLTEDCIKGGTGLSESTRFGVAFARAGMDFLSTSRGGKFEDAMQPKPGAAAYPYTGPSGYECMPQFLSDERGPYGRNIGPTAQIRTAIREAGFETPVVVTGGIHNFQQAEGVLAAGQADIIGAARQSLADPDWWSKMRMGRGDAVRLCEYTNYCEGLDQKHKQVTCKLWDRLDLDDPTVRLSQDGRRRLTAPRWRDGDKT